MVKNSIKAVVNGTTKRTIGLDLGDQYSYFCLLDEAGEKVEWGRVKTSGEALEKRFGGGRGGADGGGSWDAIRRGSVGC